MINNKNVTISYGYDVLIKNEFDKFTLRVGCIKFS